MSTLGFQLYPTEVSVSLQVSVTGFFKHVLRHMWRDMQDDLEAG